ncbi:MAG: N-acylglucosamine 2-epimerase family protein [Methanomicrobiales archaeon 53_19]|jgi:hypothetical protein|uniref:thioredoxin domain-containing protein n=1 Tax=Methanocalculus sp. TaxID=2004547 RepID=UPI000749AB19|nr:thioredoxin domain-containing protein [Methanocalculus sp.]KUK68879.1 MAG: N-acylglucosamine 2-epimerase family protein [Methanocalculus sp. 52_23]KUL03962.1 MAG: N-acylglucosamine 2-epimerase family protein [Methanomicrobiales archaeon 53_19]HIJ06352.1 thioredoxin domain-containing protein [Methanocalculus sp.]
MANRLIDEKSPYLRQHADNPIDWHPFSDEAFEKAREADIPVFLSVGYSTCHWCHVMNRESFSDTEVARALAGRFIAVKVDREERPEVDRIAMTTCQLMTGSGGWPLTLVLTPDKRPFFAGTYIPKEPRYGSAGLLVILDRIWELWRDRREEAESLGRRVEEAVRSYLAGDIRAAEPVEKEKNPTDAAYAALRKTYDREYGGLGEGMKFPSPHFVTFLLRYGGVAGIPEATEMALETLHAMRRGGINDQVGGGFHRYTTDRQWKTPHYEKMAIDQALLLHAFSEGYAVCGDMRLKEEALRIAAYIRSDLTSPEGLFYTAEDAESGGEEGGFYLWSKEEIQSLFGGEEGDAVADLLLGDAADTEKLPLRLTFEPDDPSWLHQVRERLADARRSRPRPFRDEKILLDANAKIIGALARSGHLLDEPDLMHTAEEAYSKLRSVIDEADGDLFHSMVGGLKTSNAYLPDYADLIAASVELHQGTQEPGYLISAIDHTEAAVRIFYNPDANWFWFEAEKRSLYRTRDIEDAAGPSGNAVMLHNLLLLHRITGKPEFWEIADSMMASLQPAFLGHPNAYIHSISSYHHLSPAAIDVVTVSKGGIFDDAIRSSGNLLATHLHVSPSFEEFIEMVPKIQAYITDADEPVAYPCRHAGCLPPVRDPDELRDLLSSAFHHTT